jgi:chromate reductase
MKVLGLCGSLRAKSFNLMALKLAGQLMPHGMSLSIAEIGDLPLYNLDVQEAGWPPPVLRLRDQMFAADGVLIASPEYNGTMPAGLKNSIDWMSRFRPTPFTRKPCALISAAQGPLGGVRVQYEIRRSLGLIEAMILPKPEVFIGMAQDKFAADGSFKDEPGRRLIAEQMQAFEAWITRLKAAFG